MTAHWQGTNLAPPPSSTLLSRGLTPVRMPLGLRSRSSISAFHDHSDFPLRTWPQAAAHDCACASAAFILALAASAAPTFTSPNQPSGK